MSVFRTGPGSPPTAAAPRWPAPVWRRETGPFELRLIPSAHPGADIEKGCVVLGVLAILALALLPLNGLAALADSCRFHDLTGYPCITCGATRSVLALSRGAVLDALRMNPLIGGALVLLVAYAPVALGLWIARAPRPRIALRTRRARWTALAVFVVLLLAQWAFLVVDGR